MVRAEAEVGIVYPYFLKRIVMGEKYIIEPGKDFKAAIKEGLRSLEDEPALSIEQARRILADWRQQAERSPG